VLVALPAAASARRTESKGMSDRNPRTGRLAAAASALLQAAAGLGACILLLSLSEAALVRAQNLVDLVRYAESIVIGTVESVSDGIDAGRVPYTEVTLRVSETLRGARGTTFTFRQFGLMKPGDIGGRTVQMVTPDGWPTWTPGERVMVFLNRPAHLTGLRTTVGLGQGKFSLSGGTIVNAEQNLGLFRGLEVDSAHITEAQAAMLRTDGVAVDAGTFTSLVRTAVEDRWVETGVLRHQP